jgi:hypothetical protein
LTLPFTCKAGLVILLPVESVFLWHLLQALPPLWFIVCELVAGGIAWHAVQARPGLAVQLGVARLPFVWFPWQ